MVKLCRQQSECYIPGSEKDCRPAYLPFFAQSSRQEWSTGLSERLARSHLITHNSHLSLFTWLVWCVKEVCLSQTAWFTHLCAEECVNDNGTQQLELCFVCSDINESFPCLSNILETHTRVQVQHKYIYSSTVLQYRYMYLVFCLFVSFFACMPLHFREQ